MVRHLNSPIPSSHKRTKSKSSGRPAPTGQVGHGGSEQNERYRNRTDTGTYENNKKTSENEGQTVPKRVFG